jgi:hypothetical protein
MKMYLLPNPSQQVHFLLFLYSIHNLFAFSIVNLCKPDTHNGKDYISIF